MDHNSKNKLDLLSASDTAGLMDCLKRGASRRDIQRFRIWLAA